MEEIYDILSKHFLKETSEEEERSVSEFKVANPKEYKILYEIWNKEDIHLHDFDSIKAWKEFNRRIGKKPQKIIHLYRQIRNIAAVFLILVIGSIAVLYFSGRLNSQEILVAENTADDIDSLELTDGSVIWLNKGASLSYPEKFTGTSRQVTLAGEAYFQVTSDKRHPFIVTTANSEITVLGTSFNVNSTAIQTEVSVRTGKVQVTSNITEEQTILDPNQTALVTSEKLVGFETINQNYLAWKTGNFEFLDTPIEKVVRDLNTYYDIRIEIDTTKQYACSLTAKFNNTEIEEVIEILQTTCDLTIDKLDNKFKIR